MINIGDKEIGNHAPCYITLEAGPTIDGFDTAKNLINIEQNWLNNIKNNYLETKEKPPYNQLDIDSLVNQINQDTSE